MEQVLVVSRSLFDQLGAFQGFQPDAGRYLTDLLNPENNFFMDRPAAEEDPSHKQLIPYSLFHHSGRLLCYTRGGKGGEKRLHAKKSVGIGGHINPVDQTQAHLGEQTYNNGVEREITEELRITGSYKQKVIGLINDDSNDVGRVHLGVVHWFDLESDDVASNEDAIQDLQFVPINELVTRIDELETWSAFCVKHVAETRP
ncbi:MAG: NUDIX domain-containing protein [Verrucomicrobiaceae bacterium]|nr:NUDIX domain-containing protein [Verrucomicrobiaceae bacterium]